MRRRASAKRRSAAAGAATRRSAPAEIKITRNSPRPQIKASRGPGGPVPRREVAPSLRGGGRRPRSLSDADRRVAETRKQTLNSMGAKPPVMRSNSSRPASPGHGGGSVNAVSVGAGGAAVAARVVHEVARPARAAARPVLRVVGGGIEALPHAAGAAASIWRGRLLILLVGVLAAGLIYINVGKLEYGDGYARYANRALELQRENTALRSRITSLSSAERIQRYAKAHGMYVPAPEQYTYLRPRRGDALRARGYAPPVTDAVPAVGVPEGASATTGASAAAGASAAVGAPSAGAVR